MHIVIFKYMPDEYEDILNFCGVISIGTWRQYFR